MALTVKRVAKLMRNVEPGRYLDSGGTDGVRGLYLVVQNCNAAHWELRFELHGRARWMGLGSAFTFSLAEARERAKEHRQKLADKIDPLDARRAERAAKRVAAAKAMTFKECAEAYIVANQNEWKNIKHAKQWSSTLETYAYPIIGNLPVAAIDTGLVLKILEQHVKGERGYAAGSLWQTRRETASRLRGRIESVLGWATVRGYRSGDNPAQWRNHLEEALPKATVAVTHHAAMPYGELPAFMAAMRQREGTAARALEFAVLTAARVGETLGAKWDEIDFAAATWTVPAARMKGNKEHRVPLVPAVFGLLQALPREGGNPFVFIGTKAGAGLSATAVSALLRRVAGADRVVTVHGFRSSFRDWAAERTHFPSEVAEMALAHTVPDKVERAYRRGDLLDKRRKLMDAWATYCTSPPNADNVVMLGGTR